MPLDNWLAFAIASIVLQVIPGPTILAVISYSVSHGRQACVPLVVAVALGDTTAVVASLAGLGTLLANSTSWFTIIKVIGGIYLLYLGAKMIFEKASNVTNSAKDTEGRSQPNNRNTSTSGVFLNTYVITALNPKGIVFFIAFLPQFVSDDANIYRQLFIMAVTFVILATINAFLYSFFAASIRSALQSAKINRWFNFTGGSLLCAAGLWTLIAKRQL